jgi:UDP-N-acetylmuramoyl-tripeptide--D-alanyl-D-alanine ligase
MSGTATLIDDCYNASPVSMKAGIEKLTELHIASNAQGRKIAVLGDMLELGAESASLHKELLGILLEQGIDKVYTAGPLMQQLYDILPTAMRAGCALTSAALIPMLKSSLNPGDTVLLKGSYGSRMSVIRDALLATSRTSSRETLDAV